MTVAAALLLYVVAVLAVGPRLLLRITADGGDEPYIEKTGKVACSAD